MRLNKETKPKPKQNLYVTLKKNLVIIHKLFVVDKNRPAVRSQCLITGRSGEWSRGKELSRFWDNRKAPHTEVVDALLIPSISHEYYPV